MSQEPENATPASPTGADASIPAAATAQPSIIASAGCGASTSADSNPSIASAGSGASTTAPGSAQSAIIASAGSGASTTAPGSGQPAIIVSAGSGASTVADSSTTAPGSTPGRELPIVRSLPRRRRSAFGTRVGLWSLGLLAGGFCGYSALRAMQPAPAPPAAPAPAPGTGPDAGAGPLPDTVKITIQTIPPVKAEVWWGKKKLGLVNGVKRPPIKPLIVERPRDSGPMDLVVKADTYLPVNTRAYTFNDYKLNVKLTLETDKHTLLGFRNLPDAGLDASAPDAGRPPGSYGPLPQPQPQPQPVPQPPP